MTAHKVTAGPLKVLSAISILALALLIGLAFDLLVRDQVPGLGLALFFTLGCLSVPAVRRPARPETYALLAGAWVLTVWTMIRDAEYLVVLDIIAALLLASLAASAEVYDLRVWTWRVREHVGSWYDQLAAALRGATDAIKGLLGERDRIRFDRVVPYLRGVAIAIPVFFVFALLLSASDAVFGKFLDDSIPDWDLEFGTTTTHVIWTLVAAWVVAGVLTFVVQPERRQRGGNAPAAWVETGRTEPERPVAKVSEAKRPALHARAGYVEVMIVLCSVTALIALFVGFQFAYLFGGESQIELPGVTYAEYAREGFFQLLAVATLVAALVWTAVAVAGEGLPVGRRRVFRVICSLMIVLTAVVLTSALKRLGLYEDAYGFTRLRFLAHVFTFWIAVVLALLLAQVFWTRRHLFVSGVVVTAFLAWFAVNALNPDARIAAGNLDRALQQNSGGSVRDRSAAIATQFRYVTELSADAIPAVAKRIESNSPVVVAGVADELDYWFCSQLPHYQGFAEWNLGRERAEDSVRALRGGMPEACFDR